MRMLGLALATAATVWLAAVLAAPAAVRSPHVSIATAALLTYAAGSRVCHQRPDRSFHFAGGQAAVCGRCTGLYAGSVAGGWAVILAGIWRRRGRSGWWSDRWLLAVAALPTAVSWSLEHGGVTAQSNLARFGAAVPLGAAAAWVVIGLLREAGTQRPGPAG